MLPEHEMETETIVFPEPEVQAVMNWTKSQPFVLSVALQGGAVLTTYPYSKPSAVGKFMHLCKFAEFYTNAVCVFTEKPVSCILKKQHFLFRSAC